MHTLDDCIDHLNTADCIVGFNSVEFDIPCLEGASDRDITSLAYDILQDIWAALGEKTKGYGLGAVCQRTLSIEKNGNGERAPKLYQEGRYAELIDYNIHDVHMTRKLANFIRTYGHIIDVEGNPLALPALDADA